MGVRVEFFSKSEMRKPPAKAGGIKMNKRTSAQSKDTAKPTFILGRGFLLQCKCACGSPAPRNAATSTFIPKRAIVLEYECACDGSAGARDERAECTRKKTPSQHKSANGTTAGDVSPSSTRKKSRRT